uniref:Arg8-vasotocin receptor-like n=1 Tax=Petromyzon marinus TaxID=7757 RepID=A0AAJ7TWQ2_PETMA|nr:arg8-vasotocin receptor-like [Petromyzon marinus]
MANGTANASESTLSRDEDLAKVEITILAIILCAAVVGNACVLLALLSTKKKTSRMHLFIMHLSIADLVVAFFQVLPQLIWEVTFRFNGSDILCRTVKYLQILGMFASTYMLIMMAMDRYIAICHPLRTIQQSSTQSYMMILVSWLVSFLFSVPQAYIFSLREVQQGTGVYDCWAAFVEPWGLKAYVTWTAVAVFVAPVAVLLWCYGMITAEIWRNMRAKMERRGGRDGRPPPKGTPARSSAAVAPAATATASRVSSVRNISKAKIRTTKMTFVIIVVYVFCWTPFFLVQMWSVWDGSAPFEGSAFTIVMLLASLNSCTNPWIYMFFSGHLIYDFAHCIPCCAGALRRLETTGAGHNATDRLSATPQRHRSVTLSSCSQK